VKGTPVPALRLPIPSALPAVRRIPATGSATKQMKWISGPGWICCGAERRPATSVFGPLPGPGSVPRPFFGSQRGTSRVRLDLFDRSAFRFNSPQREGEHCLSVPVREKPERRNNRVNRNLRARAPEKVESPVELPRTLERCAAALPADLLLVFAPLVSRAGAPSHA
jgi:hypothetical protein